MNRRVFSIVLAFVFVLVGGVAVVGAQQKPNPSGAPPNAGADPLAPAGSAFTYQGRLTASGSPANGQYDLKFTLFDALTGTNQVGSPITATNQTVSDGLFTLSLDFGTGAFQGSARYLELAVRPTGGGSFTTLSPRQALTAAPYALSLKPGAVITGTTGGIMLSALNYGTGYGMYGGATNGSGVYGESTSGIGAHGASDNIGVFGESTSGNGVAGESYATSNGRGVSGVASCATCYGVYGQNSSGIGIYGTSTSVDAIKGVVSNTYSGLAGINTGNGYGVFGSSSGYIGGYFTSNSADAVKGVVSNIYSGVAGVNNGSGYGTFGSSANGIGVYGTSTGGYAVYGYASGAGGFAKGVYGVNPMEDRLCVTFGERRAALAVLDGVQHALSQQVEVRTPVQLSLS